MNESKPNQVKVPVAILKAGETRSIQTVLEFPDSPVTFNLVEGSGPVYIHGQQVPGNYEIEDTTELSGEEEEVSWIWTNNDNKMKIVRLFFLFYHFIVFLKFISQDDDEDIKEKIKSAKNAINKNGKKK